MDYCKTSMFVIGEIGLKLSPTRADIEDNLCKHHDTEVKEQKAERREEAQRNKSGRHHG